MWIIKIKCLLLKFWYAIKYIYDALSELDTLEFSLGVLFPQNLRKIIKIVKLYYYITICLRQFCLNFNYLELCIPFKQYF